MQVCNFVTNFVNPSEIDLLVTLEIVILVQGSALENPLPPLSRNPNVRAELFETRNGAPTANENNNHSQSAYRPKKYTNGKPKFEG